MISYKKVIISILIYIGLIYIGLIMSSLVFASTSNINHGNLIYQIEKSDNKLYNSSKEYLIQYYSISGLDGTNRQETAVLFLPKGLPPKKGWPLIVWNHGTTGINPKCAPSLNPRTARDEPYINTWLSLGYAVLSPDYENLGYDSNLLHLYFHSKSEAFSILYAIKAMNNIDYIDKDNIILTGQSQGAHAGFSALIYKNEYAPEVNIKQTILTGIPYFNGKNFWAIQSNDNLANARAISYAIYLYHTAKQLNNKLKMEDYFDKKIIPYVKMGSTTCLTSLYHLIHSNYHLYSDNNNILKIKEFIKPKFKQIIALNEFKFKSFKTDVPILLGAGTKDTDTDIRLQKQFFKRLSKENDNVIFYEYKLLNHSDVLNTSLKDILKLNIKNGR